MLLNALISVFREPLKSLNFVKMFYAPRVFYVSTPSFAFYGLEVCYFTFSRLKSDVERWSTTGIYAKLINNQSDYFPQFHTSDI